MKQLLITFRSVTYAQRGERALTAVGIRCRIQRTPKWMEQQGCGYSLRLRDEDGEGAVDLLRREKIPLRRVYREQEDGLYREVTL